MASRTSVRPDGRAAVAVIKEGRLEMGSRGIRCKGINGARLLGLGCLLAATSGCVSAGAYNSMLAQQQAIEAVLRDEIAADQVKIEELENGIRIRMSSDLLYGSGSVELSPRGRAALDKVAPQLAPGTGAPTS